MLNEDISILNKQILHEFSNFFIDANTSESPHIFVYSQIRNKFLFLLLIIYIIDISSTFKERSKMISL